MALVLLTLVSIAPLTALVLYCRTTPRLRFRRFVCPDRGRQVDCVLSSDRRSNLAGPLARGR